jgi:putative MFS transporter
VLASKSYSVVSSLTFTWLVFLGYPIGSALSLPIIERVDRKWLIVGSALLMSLFGLGLGYSTASGAIIAFGFMYTTVSNVFSNGLHIFQVEIFPTFARATASGMAYGLSRLSSGAMPFVLLPVLERWGAGPMFAVIAAALSICIVDVALFAPRTTGRPLEQVSA